MWPYQMHVIFGTHLVMLRAYPVSNSGITPGGAQKIIGDPGIKLDLHGKFPICSPIIAMTQIKHVLNGSPTESLRLEFKF